MNMGVLELIAEEQLGTDVLKKRPSLKRNLALIEEAAGNGKQALDSSARKKRISAIVELCFEYHRETDPAEQENILRTLDEVMKNEEIEMPTQDIEEWDKQLRKEDPEYAKLQPQGEKRAREFLKKYFSLRAKAGLKTQADVAAKSGLSRAYVAVIESGEHHPQQKTFQKLARAFHVDVTDLM